ncbi:MAG: response regulator [Planctomycetota bacterium]|nr:response regulator [Planctomycetota bacterium]
MKTSTQDPTLLRVFETEVEDSVDRIHSALFRFDRRQDQGDPIPEEVFRLFHGLKGSARVMGNEQAASLAHAAEDRLQTWEGSARPDSSEIEMLVSAAEQLREIALDPENSDIQLRARHMASRLRASKSCPAPEEKERSQRSRKISPQKTPWVCESSQERDTVTVRREPFDRVVDGVSGLLSDAFAAERCTEGLTRVLHHLVKLPADTGLGQEFAAIRRELRKVTHSVRDVARLVHEHAGQLAGHVRHMCGVPVRGLLVHLERTARDAGRSLGRSVHLNFDQEIEDLLLDGDLVEGLKEPLAHMIRNAVDHGIEPASERRHCGKPERGVIHLGFTVRSDVVEIELRDDGRGLNLTALRLHLGSSADSLTDREVAAAIFHPGLSTKNEASEISGRGVGLSAVAAMVADLRGQLSVDSTPGEGTTFRLVLPRNLSVLKGLVVEVSGVRCVIPAHGMEEVGDRTGGEHSLARIFGLPEGKPAARVRLKGRTGTVDVSVDHIGSCLAEVISRPLSSHLGAVPFVQGAAILSRGDLALVLDARGLADRILGASASDGSFPQQDRRILVVDDSATMRAHLAQSLRAQGWEVELASSGEEAVECFRTQGVSAVVTDIQMPGGDGFEVLKVVARRVPTFVVTSYPSEVDRGRALALGAREYLTKSEAVCGEVVDLLASLLPTFQGARS